MLALYNCIVDVRIENGFGYQVKSTTKKVFSVFLKRKLLYDYKQTTLNWS